MLAAQNAQVIYVSHSTAHDVIKDLKSTCICELKTYALHT